MFFACFPLQSLEFRLQKGAAVCRRFGTILERRHCSEFSCGVHFGRQSHTSLLYPCFKTALCYGVWLFRSRVSPSSRFRPELAPKRGRFNFTQLETALLALLPFVFAFVLLSRPALLSPDVSVGRLLPALLHDLYHRSCKGFHLLLPCDAHVVHKQSVDRIQPPREFRNLGLIQPATDSWNVCSLAAPVSTVTEPL